ncbi:MAG: LuxR C-terminal-related transcriptional regulator [Oscillospiraceae bacterium]|nr:LuxR C-terminal-related transcriptional regulator [Oscillospiraceae bacterium]
MIRDALALWKQTRLSDKKGSSMHLRLFAFFSFFIASLVIAFLFLMMFAGMFDRGVKESRLWAENELDHLVTNASSDFGKLSLQGVAFAEQMTTNLNLALKEQGIRPADLQSHPELLEELLRGQMPLLLSALNYQKCSGAYVILNATVNSSLENADYSRAGVFLKRTEPNTVNLVGSKLHYLRGPASIARDNGIELLGQWQMEFDVSDADFYYTTISNAQRYSGLTLSRLYYWSHRVLLVNNSEPGMLLCLPLIGDDGIVFGVCGVEVSFMLFKQMYSPDNSLFPRIFSTLCPLDQNVLEMDEGLIAGNSYLNNFETGQAALISNNNAAFSSYQANDDAYGGLHREIPLYPAQSAYESERWALAVLIPENDLASAMRGRNIPLYLALAILFLVSLCTAAFISKRYISPVLEALNLIKNDQYAERPKTKYVEINDLFAYLAAQDEEKEERAAELAQALQQAKTVRDPLSTQPDLTAYEAFVRNIATLSAAEKAVFNLYMDGHTAKEIAEILCLSMNTIKTHNKRIYTKLNVTSRKELMVYVQMMTSRGQEE